MPVISLNHPRQPPLHHAAACHLREAALGLAGAFGAEAEAIQTGDTKGFDSAIVKAIRDSVHPSQSIGPGSLADAVRNVTSHRSYWVLTVFVLVTVVHLLVTQRRFEAIYLSVAVIIGTGLGNLLMAIFTRPRSSFPNAPEVFSASVLSDYATRAAVVFPRLRAMLAFHHTQGPARVMLVGRAMVLTLLLRLSRIYLGLHVAIHVIASWCLGTARVTACSLIAQQLTPSTLIGAPVTS